MLKIKQLLYSATEINTNNISQSTWDPIYHVYCFNGTLHLFLTVTCRAVPMCLMALAVQRSANPGGERGGEAARGKAKGWIQMGSCSFPKQEHFGLVGALMPGPERWCCW